MGQRIRCCLVIWEVFFTSYFLLREKVVKCHFAINQDYTMVLFVHTQRLETNAQMKYLKYGLRILPIHLLFTVLVCMKKEFPSIVRFRASRLVDGRIIKTLPCAFHLTGNLRRSAVSDC
jgi:hypothetical protein